MIICKKSKWLSMFHESFNYASSDKIDKTAKSQEMDTFVNFDSFVRPPENFESEDWQICFNERVARFKDEEALPRTEAEYRAYLAIFGDFILFNYPKIKKEFDSLVLPKRLNNSIAIINDRSKNEKFNNTPNMR